MFQPRPMTTFLMLSLTRARKISLSVPTTAMAIPQASSTRFPGSKRWRASIRRSNGKFFPTIPDDSTGFEDSKVVSGSQEPKYLSQDLTPEIITDFVAMSYNEDFINSAYREGIH